MHGGLVEALRVEERFGRRPQACDEDRLVAVGVDPRVRGVRGVHLLERVGGGHVQQERV